MNIVSAVILCTIVGAVGAIVLVAAASTSLSFMGFGGIVENLFNVTL